MSTQDIQIAFLVFLAIFYGMAMMKIVDSGIVARWLDNQAACLRGGYQKVMIVRTERNLTSDEMECVRNEIRRCVELKLPIVLPEKFKIEIIALYK